MWECENKECANIRMCKCANSVLAHLHIYTLFELSENIAYRNSKTHVLWRNFITIFINYVTIKWTNKSVLSR